MTWLSCTPLTTNRITLFLCYTEINMLALPSGFRITTPFSRQDRRAWIWFAMLQLYLWDVQTVERLNHYLITNSIRCIIISLDDNVARWKFSPVSMGTKFAPRMTVLDEIVFIIPISYRCTWTTKPAYLIHWWYSYLRL